MSIKQVKEIAEAVGGKIESMGRLPDGSGFATVSMPLPKDHWLYAADPPLPNAKGRRCRGTLAPPPYNESDWLCGLASPHEPHDVVARFEPPPMRLRMGLRESVAMTFAKTSGLYCREELAEIIREAGKYAIRAATLNGSDMDFDPDALLRNLVVGFLGYWTEDGRTADAWANPPYDQRPK